MYQEPANKASSVKSAAYTAGNREYGGRQRLQVHPRHSGIITIGSSGETAAKTAGEDHCIVSKPQETGVQIQTAGSNGLAGSNQIEKPCL